MTEHDAIVVSAPWFEDFHVGLQFDAPAVTLTEGHAALYQALFGDRLRLPLDRHASARITGTDAPLAHPLLAINVAIGQSTWASQRVKANLFYRGLRLQRPVYLGDSLYTRTRVVALRQNRPQEGRAATGIVALEMTTTNQRGETVLHFWRCPMIPVATPPPERDMRMISMPLAMPWTARRYRRQYRATGTCAIPWRGVAVSPATAHRPNASRLKPATR